MGYPSPFAEPHTQSTRGCPTMRIRTKIIGLAAVPCVALLATNINSWNELRQTSGLALESFEHEINIAERIESLNESIVYLLNADRDAHQALIAEKDILAAATPEAVRAAGKFNAENLQQIVDRMQLASAVFDDEMRALRAKFENDFAVWKRFSEAIVADRVAGKSDPTLADRHARSIKLFDTMRVHIDDLQNLMEERIVALTTEAAASREQIVADIDTNTRSATTVSLALGGGALALTLGLATVICLSVFRRLGNLLARMSDVAEGDGDLTIRINDSSKDECGMLAQQFDTFVGRVQEIMKAVSESSQSVASAATEIAASNEEMSAGLTVQSEQTQQVAEATQRMAETANQVANRSSEGGQVVSQTIEQIEQIAGAVQNSADKVGELGRKSDEIGQIISVINDIADQTNLLALNAAIEAARAGEHGRGFAVVADEVRKLAERTTKATEQVGTSIKEIQQETSSAVTNMQAGRDKVQHGVDYARRAGDALSAIVSAAEQQSGVTQEIAQSIDHLNSVAMQSREGAQQAAAAATQLSSEAEKLQSLVNRFKV